MRILIRGLLLLVLALPLVASAARASEPFTKVETRTIAALQNKPGTAEDVRKAFLIAATRLGYTVTPREDGSLAVRLLIRSHVLDFTVKFNDNGYITEYVSSENLGFVDEETPKIHPKVRQWLDKLYQTTASEVLRF